MCWTRATVNRLYNNVDLITLYEQIYGDSGGLTFKYGCYRHNEHCLRCRLCVSKCTD